MALAVDPIFSQQFSNVRPLVERLEYSYSDLSMDPGPSPEHRNAMRYRLRLPVIFHWDDGADHTEGGFTRDVALDGALIQKGDPPALLVP